MKHFKFIALVFYFLRLDIYAAEDPAILDWCFDNIQGTHQMLGSPPMPIGPSTELMHYLAEKVGYTLNYIAPVPSLRCLKLLGKGEVDIMTNLTYLPHLAETVYFYKYLDSINPIKLVVLADDKRNINSVDKLIALRGMVLLVRGFKYGDGMTKLTKNEHFSNVFVNSAEDALKMLKMKRADAALLPSQNALSIEKKNQELHLFKHIDLPPELRPSGPIYVGFSKNSKDAHLGPKIEAVLNEAIQSGYIERLRKKANLIHK